MCALPARDVLVEDRDALHVRVEAEVAAELTRARPQPAALEQRGRVDRTARGDDELRADRDPWARSAVRQADPTDDAGRALAVHRYRVDLDVGVDARAVVQGARDVADERALLRA